MKTSLLLYSVMVMLALAQPVKESELQQLIRLSDIIIKGEVIKTEEQKVISIEQASTGICYVRPDRSLKGNPVKTELTLMDNMPVVVRYRLVHAVRELAFRINRAGSVTISVQTTGFIQRLYIEYETTLYRICQEWINNILKYSNATQVNVQLVEHDDEVTIMIEDNGAGFDTSLLDKAMGNGWKNIESRIQLIKGHVEVDSSPKRGGTTFMVNVPYSIKSEMKC